MNDDHDPPTVDDRLRAALGTAASHLEVAGDTRDVRRRLRRRRQVQTSLVGAAAVVAVIAAVAVWPGGDDQRVSVATGSAPNAATAIPTTTVVVSLAPGEQTTNAAEQILQKRTTADGLQLTVGLVPDTATPATAWWTPPASCGADGSSSQVEVDVSDTRGQATNAISSNMTLGSGGAPGDTIKVSPTFLGAMASAEVGSLTTVIVPTTGTAVLSVTGTDLAHVAATFTNGAKDEADATNGAVILGVRDVTAVGESAGVVSRLVVTLKNGRQFTLSDPSGSPSEYDTSGAIVPSSPTTTVPTAPECVAPPPPLPAAGAQPADATAARASVTAAIDGYLDGSRTEAQRESFMVDPAFGQQVETELGAGYAAAAASARAKVDDLVFVSPTRAIVRYDVDITPTGKEPIPIPAGFFHNTFGEVDLVGGRWLVTPETLCKITSTATPKACAAHPAGNYPAEIYGPDGTATKPASH